MTAWVLELVGLGEAAAANSPAVAGFLGGKMSAAAAVTAAMSRICASISHPAPATRAGQRRDTAGCLMSAGVVESYITPAANTGIVHISDGSDHVGAGVARAHIECFRQALLNLDRRLS